MTTDPYATASELGLMEGFPPPPGKRVDRSNALMVPPFNRWAYLHMRTIFPSAAVRNPLRPRPVNIDIDSRIAELAVPRADGSAATVQEFLRETYTDAFVVVTPEAVVYEHYDNGMTPIHPHQMMSVTKSFADATVGQVMDMTNSMDFSEEYADPASGIWRYGQALGWLEIPGAPSDESLYDFLVTLQKDPAYEHGEVFHYQTPKTDVVNWITNRATGKSFQDLMSDVLWSPLGAEAETYVLLDRCGTLVAGGGLNAAPRDLARFAMMLLDDGRVGGEQIVAPAVIETLEKGGSRAAFAAGPEAVGAFTDWSYRAQWWIRHTPNREAITAIGVHGQWIYVDRARGVAIVKQSSQPTSVDPDIDQFILNAFDAVIDRVRRR